MSSVSNSWALSLHVLWPPTHWPGFLGDWMSVCRKSVCVCVFVCMCVSVRPGKIGSVPIMLISKGWDGAFRSLGYNQPFLFNQQHDQVYLPVTSDWRLCLTHRLTSFYIPGWSYSDDLVEYFSWVSVSVWSEPVFRWHHSPHITVSIKQTAPVPVWKTGPPPPHPTPSLQLMSG